MTGLEQHRQHLAPELFGGHRLEQSNLAPGRHRFVFLVPLPEGVAVQVMQVRSVVWREQGPVLITAHAFDQQVRYPVSGVHVVSTTTFIAGVLAQLQELLDIQVPAFQISTHGTLALATLIHRHRRVVHHFQEWHHTLAAAVGPLDVGAQSPDWRPVVTQTAGPLGQHGVVADGAVDALQIILNGGEVAG